MPSDLTERLAAKLSSVREPWGFAWESESPEGQTYAELVADYAPTLLPLLLSEPELVAPLPDEVRLSVLTPRERADLKVAAAAHAMGMGEPPKGAIEDFYVALGKARALTPEGKDG